MVSVKNCLNRILQSPASQLSCSCTQVGVEIPIVVLSCHTNVGNSVLKYHPKLKKYLVKPVAATSLPINSLVVYPDTSHHHHQVCQATSQLKRGIIFCSFLLN